MYTLLGSPYPPISGKAANLEVPTTSLGKLVAYSPLHRGMPMVLLDMCWPVLDARGRANMKDLYRGGPGNPDSVVSGSLA